MRIQPDRVDRAQDTPVHVGGARGIGRIVRRRRGERRAEEHLLVDLRTRLLVQPGQRVIDRADRTPVGHYEAGIAPVLLQYPVEQIIAAACRRPVDAVVGAHHRTGPPLVDRDLEGEQVAHAEGVVGDPAIDRMPARLLRIEREMLDRRQDVLRLDAGDRRTAQHARMQRILTEIFERPPAARVAHQVDAPAQQHVEALGSRLARNHRATATDQVRVPGRPHRRRRRQRGRAVLA